MREPTIARNYAEALYLAAERRGESERYADLLDGLAGALETDPKVRGVFDSPRVPKPAKQQLVADVLRDRQADILVRFLGAVIKRGRQMLIPAIRDEFAALLDVKYNRVHAGITTAREVDSSLRETMAARLSERAGKTVVPHFRVDPAILGGVVVRLGDRILDGSVRRRLVHLRRQMLRV